MKVSVVVPLYNKARWVMRSLDSIAAQTFGDFEVVVVDDGSTDGSAELVAAYRDPRFRLIRQANAGPGAARNRGIAESCAPLLAFLDADDEWLPTFLERSVKRLEAAGPDVAATACCYYEWPANLCRASWWRARGVKEGVFEAAEDTRPGLLVRLLAYMSPWATVARREVVERYGGFFGRHRCLYGEDAYLWLQVLLNEKVVFSLEPLVRFHTEASALSKNLAGARPIEPFLLYPEELEPSCPRPRKRLLHDVLAIRAAKTACMLAYWGRWREARALYARFPSSSHRPEPWRVTAALACNPLASWAARVCRQVLGAQTKTEPAGEPASVPIVPRPAPAVTRPRSAGTASRPPPPMQQQQ
jgi:GT2 family glycosyltransferase